MNASRLLVGGFAVLSIGAASAACTLVSGVEDMELRRGTRATTPADDSVDGGKPEGGSNSFVGGKDGTADPAHPTTGPTTCGAEGSWTACDPNPALTTCAARCAAQGFTCVESCCAYDSVGDYAAKVGMIYAVLPEFECTLTSVSSSGKGGLCADPTILTAGGAAQVRCCCK